MTWLLFLIFLGYLGYQRYIVGAPASVDQAYVMTAFVVLSATAIVPFFISYLLTRATQLTGRTPAILLGFISAVTLSVAGYYLIWRFFGGAPDTRLPMQEVLKLGLIPGLVMGAILAFDSIFRRSAA